MNCNTTLSFIVSFFIIFDCKNEENSINTAKEMKRNRRRLSIKNTE